MTKREFANKVAEMVNGTVHETEKANGVIWTGISILNETNINPNIYIDKMYEESWSVEQAADEVLKLNEKYKGQLSFDPNDFTNYENAKKGIKARLYNAATKASVYRSAAEYGFEDLIIIPVYQVSDNASIRITKEHIKSWGVTADEVLDLAMEQSKTDNYKIQSMFEIMCEMMGRTPEEVSMMGIPDDGNMFVVSNKSKAYGAYGIIAIKDQLNAAFPGGYIVIPSSVHECIIIPKNLAEGNDLDNMVQSVNGSELAAEEVLSDHVYIFEAA